MCSELAGAGYGYWQVGITRPFRRFALDFRFYDTNREVPIISAPDRGGARVALSVRLPFTIIGR
ncbi:MAG: hypothetical protein U5K76_09075 [Woeseiaceae bacterium]|nr:hypothetical protein [Woeseiaceae bacterium]